MQRSKRKTTEGERLEISNKIGNSKGTFHPKTEIIKDKNGRDLVDAKEIRKRWNTWKEYMERIHGRTVQNRS